MGFLSTPGLIRLLKTGVYSASKYAGIYRMIQESAWRRNRLLILCYHGISLRDEHEWCNLYVSPEFFRRRLQILKELDFKVLPLQAAVTKLYQRTLPPRSVAITFDDGFYDFHRHAVPIAEDYGYPLTLYLTTYYVKYRLPIFNLMIDYLFWLGRARTFTPTLPGLSSSVDLSSASTRSALTASYWQHAREHRLRPEERQDICRQVAESLNIDYGELTRQRVLQLMSPDEVAEISRTPGICVELHTHRHRTPLDPSLFQREIVDNRDAILEYTGRDTHHFCYPSGRHHPDMLPWLREQGVRYATTCDHALASPTDDPLLLPRLLDSEAIPELEFQGWLTGLSHLLPKRRHY